MRERGREGKKRERRMEGKKKRARENVTEPDPMGPSQDRTLPPSVLHLPLVCRKALAKE